jgi:hypothetical protein
MSAATNPYAPPKARVDDVVQSVTDAEAIRREYLKHEASVRSIGSLYYLSGGLLCIAAIGLIGMYFTSRHEWPMITFGPVYAVLGVLGIFLGRGIRHLRPWARTTSIVLGCVGLLGFPVGTLINAYILYLLLSSKGKRVFAPDYPDIIAATPHIKYRGSALTWILLGVVVILFVALAAVAIFH